jgi:hypothetical protein
MAAERCRRCSKPRIGLQAGGQGFCTACLKKVETLIPKQEEEKPFPVQKGKKGKSGGSLQPPTRQRDIDRLYEKHLHLRYLRLFVSANESGGFGDLINCLNTSQILLGCGNAWRVFARCNHPKFGTMSASFPDVEVDETAKPHLSPDVVSLDVVSRAGNETAGSIDEYGYQELRDVTPCCRGAGLAPHEMGIMINPALRKEIAPIDLPLSIGPLAEFVVRRAKLGSLRFFFGYGAGQKSPDCFHVLLDRVAFDSAIGHAVVLAVGHGPGHLQAYLKNVERRKGLGIESGVSPEPLKLKDAVAYELPIKGRAIFVLFAGSAIPYKDMLTFWRAADRSFTICEGDQSFSEAISACIPMAYQLWNPVSGSPHKQRLFKDLLECCSGQASIGRFLELCTGYGRKKFDLQSVKEIIKHVTDKEFLLKYQQCMVELGDRRSISLTIPPFVKRLWLRKLVAIDECPGELAGEVQELLKAEDEGESLGPIEQRLFVLGFRLAKLAKKLTEEQRIRRELQAPRSPNDLNYQVASALASIQALPPSLQLIVSPEIALQVTLEQLKRGEE